LPSDVREILRALGVRRLRCAVSGGVDELVSWMQSYDPGELVVEAGAAREGDVASFDRVVVVLGADDPLAVDVLLRWWELVRPAGWLVGRHPDAAAVDAALASFRRVTGVTSAVRRGADVATHWALQVPS